MGSFEEDELVQMVQDFIESESSTPPSTFTTCCSSNSLPLRLTHQTKCLSLQEVLRSGMEAERKILERVLKHMRKKRSDGVVKKSGINGDEVKQWLVMKLKMDGYDASLCQTSWVTSLGCPAGGAPSLFNHYIYICEYEYIEVIVKEDTNGDPMRLIVDIDFKSQFELARPTAAYNELTDTLPSIFVGNEEKINKVLSVLCSAAQQSLRERGLHIPPWRTTTYMQCKWLSATCHKINTCSLTPSSGMLNTEAVKVISKTANGGYSGNGNYGKWSPPMVKPKRRDVAGSGGGDSGGGGGGRSALSIQFSNMGINCCT